MTSPTGAVLPGPRGPFDLESIGAGLVFAESVPEAELVQYVDRYLMY